MSIICAELAHDALYIGSDSQTTMINGCRMYDAVKWVSGRWHIGHAGEVRALNLLQSEISRIDHCESALAVATLLREMLKDDGFKPNEDEGKAFIFDHQAIVACTEGVWSIDKAFGCVLVQGFWADGAGRDYALGAAWAVPDVDAETRMYLAIAAACRFDVGCGGEPWVKRIPR